MPVERLRLPPVADIEALLGVLQRLVGQGNTVIVIEHQLDVIRNADWIIDLGPHGGERGGLVIAEGTPEHVATIDASATGRFLRESLPAPCAGANGAKPSSRAKRPHRKRAAKQAATA